MRKDLKIIIVMLGIVTLINIGYNAIQIIKLSLLPHQPDRSPTVSLEDDFIMGDPWCVSNAIIHQAPPEGYKIVCNGSGLYAIKFGDVLFDNDPQFIRTNKFQAICVAWRAKAILDTSQPILEKYINTNNWTTECTQ